jgi:hypothetical protein
MPILILGTTGAQYARILAEHDITQAVCSLAMARELSAALGDRPLKVHYKIDTGMGRLGFSRSRRSAICRRRWRCRSSSPRASSPISPCRRIWRRLYHGAIPAFLVDTVDEAERLSGHRFQLRHCANTAR